MLKIVFGLVRAGCQRLFMRGFQFRSILYSERCAQICLAPSQNLNVWRPNISVFFQFEPIFSLRGHDWIQTTGITARGCAWMSPEETVVVFVQCFSTDVAKTSISNFGRVGTTFSCELHEPGPFCSSATTLARFFHVEFEIF